MHIFIIFITKITIITIITKWPVSLKWFLYNFFSQKNLTLEVTFLVLLFLYKIYINLCYVEYSSYRLLSN